MGRLQSEIMKTADQNTHTVRYLLAQPRKTELENGDMKLMIAGGPGAVNGVEEEDESMVGSDDGQGWIGFD